MPPSESDMRELYSVLDFDVDRATAGPSSQQMFAFALDTSIARVRISLFDGDERTCSGASASSKSAATDAVNDQPERSTAESAPPNGTLPQAGGMCNVIGPPGSRPLLSLLLDRVGVGVQASEEQTTCEVRVSQFVVWDETEVDGASPLRLIDAWNKGDERHASRNLCARPACAGRQCDGATVSQNRSYVSTDTIVTQLPLHATRRQG